MKLITDSKWHGRLVKPIYNNLIKTYTPFEIDYVKKHTWLHPTSPYEQATRNTLQHLREMRHRNQL